VHTKNERVCCSADTSIKRAHKRNPLTPNVHLVGSLSTTKISQDLAITKLFVQSYIIREWTWEDFLVQEDDI
jgi:hypothetical protein